VPASSPTLVTLPQPTAHTAATTNAKTERDIAPSYPRPRA
jgi:hypothetical protein